LWEVDNVALWRIDEDFIGKESKFELIGIDFFAAREFRCGFLEFLNPKKVAREFTDAAFSVSAREFLLVIEEGGRKTAFGVVVHFLGTNLELDNLFVWSNYGRVKRLVAVLFWHGDVIFDAAVHWVEEGMNEAEDEIAGRNIFDDKTERNKVIDTIDVLIVLGELLVKRINGFDAAITLVFDVLFLEDTFDGSLCVLEFFVGALEAFGGEFLELFVTLWVEIFEASLLDFDTNATHLETVGERRKDIE